MAAAVEQIPPFPPLPKGGDGGYRPADDLSEQHWNREGIEQFYQGARHRDGDPVHLSAVLVRQRDG
jgi:hypothetical protein